MDTEYTISVLNNPSTNIQILHSYIIGEYVRWVTCILNKAANPGCTPSHIPARPYETTIDGAIDGGATNENDENNSFQV
jgi:hypothetical protein